MSGLIEAVKRIRGIDVFEPDERYSVDGVLPKVVAKPNSVDSLKCLISSACENRWGVIPFGGGTAMHIGYAPLKFDIAINMANLQSIVEFEPADLTITVESGMRMCSLHSTLRMNGLFLPVDQPDEESATVGGVAATNTFGTFHFGYGAASDWIIGIQVVQPDGKLTSFGGRVVKNVAGYDMVKLYAGSYGTLGVITSVTFRLLPMPEHHAIVTVLPSEDERIGGILTRIVRSILRPSTVMMVKVLGRINLKHLEPRMSEFSEVGCKRSLLFIGFDDFVEAVNYQVDLLSDVVRNDGSLLEIARDDEAEMLRSALRRLQSGLGSALHIRLNVSPSKALPLCDEVAELASANSMNGILIVSHILDGIIFISAFDCSDDFVLLFSERLLRAVESHRGNMIIERVPTHLKQSLPIWGRDLKSHSIMRRIKGLLDERSLMSCGRFIGRI